MIVAVIPAHNEAEALPRTIASLHLQDVTPDRIFVVSDNSTDDTFEVAESLGVTAVRTSGNRHKKAGALNQVLDVIPNLHEDDLVLVMDADTELSPHFISTALDELQDGEVGGVGAVFTGSKPTTYLELCQYLEWSRYGEEIERTGKTFVMSGTAALIRYEALLSVKEGTGKFYNTDTITEDMRLTLDLKAAGWKLKSPTECTSTTEMMPTVKMLWLQRRRWYLGALQNVTDMGVNKVTLPYWRQQVMLVLSVTLLWSLLALTVTAVTLEGVSTPQPQWLAVGLIFAVERVVTVWDEPWRYRLFAAIVIPELVYALILQSAYVAAVYQKITGSDGTWAHITRKEEAHLRK